MYWLNSLIDVFLGYFFQNLGMLILLNILFLLILFELLTLSIFLDLFFLLILLIFFYSFLQIMVVFIGNSCLGLRLIQKAQFTLFEMILIVFFQQQVLSHYYKIRFQLLYQLRSQLLQLLFSKFQFFNIKTVRILIIELKQ